MIPSKYLSRDAFKRTALDFLTFGNAYLEDRPSRSGNLSMALNALRTRGKRPARAPEEAVLPQRRTLAASVASGLEKARALVGAALPRFSAA